jgi:prepilin-type N-terminal cleavage/methylation domain-containing protein
MKDKGFTLMDILLSLAILAVLLAMAAGSIRGRGLQAREDLLRTQLDLTRSALGRFSKDMGCSAKALIDLMAAPSTCVNDAGADITSEPGRWRGPYLAFLEDRDPVSGASLTYAPTEMGGRLSSSASGSDSRGTPYADY